MCLKRNVHSRCLCLTFLINLCLLGVFWCQLERIGTVVAGFNIFENDLTQLIKASTSEASCDEGVVLMAMMCLAILYITYLIECWHSTTRLILIYRTTATNVYRYIEQMRQAQPIIWWKAACYHHVRHHRPIARYQSSGSSHRDSVYSSTSSGAHYYLERINTHMAGSYFAYNACGCRDISKQLQGLELFPITRIYFTKGFAFANEQSAQEFDGQRTNFFRMNENYDHFVEIREGLDLISVPHLEYMVCSGDDRHVPWYAAHSAFWLFSLVLLSWPLRLLLEYNTAYVQYQVVKLFGTNYESSLLAPTIGSRSSTMESLNNYCIAPSYSETMLAERIYCLRSCSQTFHDSIRRPSQSSQARATKIKTSPDETQPSTSCQAKLEDDDSDDRAEEAADNQASCDVNATPPPPPTYEEVIENDDNDSSREDADSFSAQQSRFIRTVDYMHQLLNVLRARMRRTTFPRSLTDKDFFQKLFDSPFNAKQWKSLNEISNV